MNAVRNLMNKRKWARWNNTPKDLVILHTFGKTNTIPSASPFVMKVQTYLRMTKIPHKIDSKDMLGPKGKAPWISLNGQHIGDSELIIRHLNKHFNVNLNKGSYSEAQLAVATCARVTLEEHFLWGFGMERFIYNPSQFSKVISVNPMYDKLVTKIGGYVLNKRASAQGLDPDEVKGLRLFHYLGKHSQADVEELCTKDLIAVSKIMGNNRYFLGQDVCQDDCGIFGILSECLWGLPNSPYQKIIQNDLTNLRDYCLRLKREYYADWEKCIKKPQEKSHSDKSEKIGLKSKL